MNVLINLQLYILLTLHYMLIGCLYIKLKFLRAKFLKNTMEGIRNVMKINDTFIIALLIFNETKNKNLVKFYWVLSCVLYYFIENYVCVDYICCHFKTLSFVYSDKNSKKQVIMYYLVLAFQNC